jgi:UDP-N-acetyl-D-glucosamine dehydrogenase
LSASSAGLLEVERRASPPAPSGQRPSRAAVLGLGYVGLPTALALFTAGASVLGVDTSPARLRAIRAGEVDLLPADRRRLAAALLGAGSPAVLGAGSPAALGAGPAGGGEARFALDGGPGGLAAADDVLICVPTPVDAHRTPDLGPLRAACATVVAAARPGQTIVLTSTSYVGSTRDLLARPLAERGLVPGRDLHVAFSPERVDPGNAAHPPDRVPRVVGGCTTACAERAVRVLRLVASVVHRVSSPEAAEMTKLYENSFRAVNIALANELAEIARRLDLDVMEVIGAAATKPYGFMPFQPGPGVGGHCIPCDPHYLLWQLRARQAHAPLLAGAMDAIAMRPLRVVERAVDVLAGRGRSPAGARVLLAGVAYKPGVADTRESPARTILAELAHRGALVAYTDPLVPTLCLPDGSRLDSVPAPGPGDVDLVIAHTLHPGHDHGWMAAHGCVLDATYRLRAAPGRAVV